jgi:hypothetical protein
MRKVLQQLLFVSSIVVFVMSCEKGEESFPPITPVEKTIIQLPEGGNLVTVGLDISTTVQTYEILEIRRDAKSPADLNKIQIVKIAKSNAILSDFSGAAVSELGRDYYQSHPDNPFDGQNWIVTFKPGEYIKFLKINIKTIDLVSLGRVGLGFQLAEAPNAEIAESKQQVAVEIGAKNQWDGVYRIRYGLYHPTNPAITGNGAISAWAFPSSGPRSIDWDFATIFINFSTGGLTYFGDGLGPSLQVRMTVNADNTVSVSNVGSRAGALGFPPLVVPTGVTNRYDPATKTFYVAYTWTPAGSGTREKYDTITYVRPR